MDPCLQFTPQIFVSVQVRAFYKPVSNVHFSLLGVVLHQENVLLEDPGLLVTA